ncbi:hypothetical protein Ae201684P_021528 [Aphanomyces euteiches]|uniref:ABC transporter domain-containing protein n=1 Tax=Aphanomyces euteiches TaxID=100861 RepID=A0A6G0X770_9STRA|nr:hypothetical protein Ae201684_007851 [Aphanomyces euteiches]KAH9067369.1 hypothetical protein Ae201684P_021528 [Aphanomyces euteiches]
MNNLPRLVAAAVFLSAVLGAPTCKGPNEVINSDGTQCTCLKDFLGLNCRQCRTESACTKLDSSTHCAVGFSYSTSMKSKTYTCTLSDTLQAVFSDGAMGLNCDTTNKTCTMAVYKTATGPQGAHAVDCNMKDCSFSDTTVKCGTLSCLCTDMCGAVAKELFEVTLANKPVSLVTSGNSSVKVNIDGSPLPLEGTCSASSCESSKVMDELAGGSTGSSSGSTPPPASTYSKALIVSLSTVVALVGGIAFLLCCFYSLFLAKLRRSAASSSERTLEDPLQTNGFVVATAGDRFEFTDISCMSREKFRLKSLKLEEASVHAPKTILHEVSGSVHRGQLLGLMGPSGSGKTTLLNALAGVANGTTEFTGSITLDGHPLPANYRQVAAYVQQDDCLFATLTVRESIEYSAFLRLPSTLSLASKQQMVTKVIDELHLSHVADSRIGNASVRGVSGGERRRVSIGMELVTQPQMLFLDEPTSGLDSASANSLVALLSTVAKSGRIVVMSVHQPSTKSFLKLDKVLLLAKGKIMYSGPSSTVASYFANLGMPCNENENIADHILDCASDLDQMTALHDAWLSNKDQISHADTVVQTTMMTLNAFEKTDDPNWKRSTLMELQVLFIRTLRNTFRQKSLFILHLAISALLGLITGLIFMGLQNNLAGFQNRMGAFFFTLTFFGFGTLSSMDAFIQERQLFLKEAGARYYGAWSYYFAKASIDLATLRVIPAIVFACIFYYIMGLNAPADRFLLFTTTLVLFNVAVGSLSMFISIASKTVGIANLIATVWLLENVLFGGFLLNVQSMKAGVAWLQWTSLFKYAFEVMMTNELSGLLLTFDAAGYVSVPVYGEVYLRTIGMDINNQMRDVVLLIGLLVVFNVASFVLLQMQVPRAPRLTLKPKQVAAKPAI